MARIALIGGHGKVARAAAPLLLAAGHQVESIIRNPDHAEEIRTLGAAPVLLDVEHADTEAMTEALTGYDVVVWTAGAGGGDPERTHAVDRDAAIRSMDAAASAGVPRYVMLSYFGAGPDHGIPQDNPFFVYAESKAAADEHLRAAEALEGIVLAPSGLTDDPPTGAIEIATGDNGVQGGSVTRADVAAVLAAVVDRTDLGGRTLAFNNGSTPVAQALEQEAARA
ncbi:MAG: NAD(P)H-binding protein [Ornithinimicrobium sp.]|uniref:NAD(P)H-binding protein n=1 Tax=Ornithinimicrobium sp. TaxID=1977084 RepID=UPI003D9B37D5